MRQSIERFIFRKLTPWSIRYLPPPRFDGATGLAAEVYHQLDREFQAVPPITLHHRDPELMAGVWSACRETLLSGPERGLKEAMAVAVSASNRCPYCVQAHVSFLGGCAGEHPAGAEWVAWAAASGRLSTASDIVPPFTRESVPAFMGTVALFHYLNRMVNLFLDEEMMPVIGRSPLFREPALRIFGALVSSRIVAIEVLPGSFLTPDPELPLPDGFSWAADDPRVAGGLRRFAAAALRAGEALDPAVRKVVAGQVNRWEGVPRGPGKGWLADAVEDLAEAQRPQARVALLAALSPWGFNETEAAAFHRSGGDDRALLDTAAWGAYLATERIAGWFVPPR